MSRMAKPLSRLALTSAAIAGHVTLPTIAGGRLVKRLGLLISLVALLSLGLVVPVLAASPGNDVYAGRTTIATLPFSTSIDTTPASTDALDLEANAGCGAPAVDASVWFEYTPTVDGGVIFDPSASNYSAGLILLTGGPGSFTYQNCGEVLGFSLSAGVTYTILAFDDQLDGTGIGGNLILSVFPAPPPPTIALTVNATGSFNPKAGSATIRGTITCSGGDEFGKNNINLQVTQTIGRFIFTADGWTDFVCDGTTRPWSVEVSSTTGKFGGGKATVSVFGFACGAFSCANTEVDRTVTLRR